MDTVSNIQSHAQNARFCSLAHADVCVPLEARSLKIVCSEYCVENLSRHRHEDLHLNDVRFNSALSTKTYKSQISASYNLAKIEQKSARGRRASHICKNFRNYSNHTVVFIHWSMLPAQSANSRLCCVKMCVRELNSKKVSRKYQWVIQFCQTSTTQCHHIPSVLFVTVETTYQEAIRWVWSQRHSQGGISQVFRNVLKSGLTWDRQISLV